MAISTITRRLGEGTAVQIVDPRLDDAIKYLDRDDDRQLLLDKVKQRFATGVKKASGREESEDQFDTYVIGDASNALDADHYEILPSGFFGRLVDETATLFTQPNQKWMYTSAEDTAAANDELHELITYHRQLGSYSLMVDRWDRLGVAINSCWLRLGWVNGHLHYEVIRPDDIRFLFPDTIIENGDNGEVERGSLKTSIEDAYAVAIRLDADRWLSYAGRSEAYPQGRCVEYEQEEPWPLPEIGDEQIKDEYEVGGEVANPLTWLQDQKGSEVIRYEYPVARILGDAAGFDTSINPASVSLYDKVLEADVAGTRNLTAANKASQGVNAWKDPMNQGLPSNVDGNVALRRDQEVVFGGRDAVHAVNAGIVIDNSKREIAESYGVPAYRVLNTSSAPESGAALIIRHQPQIDRRNKRIRVNHDQVTRLAYLELYYLDLWEPEYTYSPDTIVVWNPGTWTPPIPSIELLGEINTAIGMNLIDQVEAVRRYHKLETREEAERLMEQFAASSSQFGAISNNPRDRLLARVTEARDNRQSGQQRQETPTEQEGEDA
jgi:hypothetical protein